MNKFEVAQILREMGVIVELTDLQPKKGIAYKRAARSIELAENFDELVKTKNWESLPGIGHVISSYIQLLVQNRKIPFYEHLKHSVPSTLLELVNIPGLNVKKIKILIENLNITSLEILQKALKEKKLNNIKGFGPTYIKKLEARVQSIIKQGYKVLYPQAKLISEAIENSLKDFCEKIVSAGELRRLSETVGSLHFIAITNRPLLCLNHFTQNQFVEKVLFVNSLNVTVLLKQGLKATLEIVDTINYPAALLKATGNEIHLIELNKELQIMKKSLKSAFLNENEIYKNAGLYFIPPELREGYGEIAAARNNDFSQLVKQDDLQGSFHCHTLASDGSNTIEELAEASMKKGWSYIGISDHSKSSYQANGLSEERLFEQIEYIHALNKKLQPSFRIFAGVECDILDEGQLDFSDYILKELDFVIVSIHSKFKQDKEIMTKRLIKAIENPFSTMVGHLSGRLLRLRNPYQFDFEKVIDACIANGKIVEMNSSPSRMDMDWRQWLKVRDRGLKCSINPDAHSLQELNNCFYGVNCARKGWLRKDDVINTLSLKGIINFLEL